MAVHNIRRVAVILTTFAAVGLAGAGTAIAEEPTPEPTPPSSSQGGLGNIEPPVCLPPLLTGNGIGRACVPQGDETFAYPERTDGSKPGLFGQGILGLL